MGEDPSTFSSFDPQAAAADLDAAITEGLAVFAHIDERRSGRQVRPGGWSVREIVGHLVDSACNNHRRFVVGQTPGLEKFDGYEQDVWVARQRYADASWNDLVTLWAAYNRHLRHVMRHTSREGAAMSATEPSGSGRVSVGFLMHDYVRHLRHHVAQVRAIAEA
jgi:hypothetical protein